MDGPGIGLDSGTPEPASHRERRPSSSSTLLNSASFHHTQQSSVRAQCLPLVEKLIGHARAQEVGQPELLSAAAAMISSLLMELEAVQDAEASRERVVKPSAWAQREAKYKQDLFELRRTITLQEEAAARLRNDLAVYRRTTGNGIDGNSTEAFEGYDGRLSHDASPLYAYKRGSLGRSYRYQEPIPLDSNIEHHRTVPVQATEQPQTAQTPPPPPPSAARHVQSDLSQLEDHTSDPIASKEYEPQRLTEERTAPFSLSPTPSHVETHYDANGLARTSRNYSRRGTSDPVVQPTAGMQNSNTQVEVQQMEPPICTNQASDQHADKDLTQLDSPAAVNGTHTVEYNGVSVPSPKSQANHGLMAATGTIDIGDTHNDGNETEQKLDAQVACLQTELESARHAAETAAANESVIKAELYSLQKQFMEEVQKAKTAAEMATKSEASARMEFEALQQRFVTELQEAKTAAESAVERERAARYELQLLQERLASEPTSAADAVPSLESSESRMVEEKQKLLAELQMARTAADTAVANEGAVKAELLSLQERLTNRVLEAEAATQVAQGKEMALCTELKTQHEQLSRDAQDAKNAAEAAAANEAKMRSELQSLLDRLQAAESTATHARDSEVALQNELAVTKEQQTAAMSEVDSLRAEVCSLKAMVAEQQESELALTGMGTETKEPETDITSQTASQTPGMVDDMVDAASPDSHHGEMEAVDQNTTDRQDRHEDDVLAARLSEVEQLVEQKQKEADEAKQHAVAATEALQVLQSELSSSQAALMAAQKQLEELYEREEAAQRELQAFEDTMAGLRVAVEEADMRRQVQEAQNIEMAEQLALLTEFVSYKAKNPKHANTLFSAWLKRRPSQHQAAGSQGSGTQQGLERMSISSTHPANAAT